MNRHRRLLEPVAVILLVVSTMLSGWLSVLLAAASFILLILLAAANFTGKKRIAVVVVLVAVLGGVFAVNGHRASKARAVAESAFVGSVEVVNRSEQTFEMVKLTSTDELGTGPEQQRKLEPGQTVVFEVEGKGKTAVRVTAGTQRGSCAFETWFDGNSHDLALELVENADGGHELREK